MRENRTSGLTSGVWKQGMEKASEAPATKRAGKQMGFSYTTAPHPDSTRLTIVGITQPISAFYVIGLVAISAAAYAWLKTRRDMPPIVQTQ